MKKIEVKVCSESYSYGIIAFMYNEFEPFVIRGHHLEVGPFGYNGVFTDGTPDEEKIISYVTDRVDFTMSCTDAFDYIGEEPKRYKARYLAVVKRFKSLPESYPIILSQTSDELCGTCIIGGHCKDKQTSAKDRYYLDMFVRCALSLSLEEGIDFKGSIGENGSMQITTTKAKCFEVLKEYKDFWEKYIFKRLFNGF